MPENIELPHTVYSVSTGYAIDLGLSVKWATCNVGAESPEDYGSYYASGETEENYNSSTGEYTNIGSNISGTSYDVAHVKWGGSWRMPTVSEIQELCNKCSWEWTSVNGVNGQKVTGPNGNSIFLPAAGYRNGTVVEGRGSSGWYWPGERSGDLASGFFFDAYDWWWGLFSRGAGCFTVRPVTE